jgi:hypothetical protein
MREESHELGAQISKLRLGDDEMSIETYIQMEGEEVIELELNTDELWMPLWESIMHKTLILSLICIR